MKNFDFDSDTSKNIFHTLTFTIWQVKDYKGKDNFILRTTFENALFPYQNVFKKCIAKTRLLMTKALSNSSTLD